MVRNVILLEKVIEALQNTHLNAISDDWARSVLVTEST